MNVHMTEEAWGQMVLAAVRAEGHRPTNFDQHDRTFGKKKRRVVRNASPATIKMMRLLAEHPYSTRQLANLVGCTNDEASYRLRSLWKGGFLDKFGEESGRRKQRSCWIYTRGPRMDEWLEAYKGVK